MTTRIERAASSLIPRLITRCTLYPLLSSLITESITCANGREGESHSRLPGPESLRRQDFNVVFLPLPDNFPTLAAHRRLYSTGLAFSDLLPTPTTRSDGTHQGQRLGYEAFRQDQDAFHKDHKAFRQDQSSPSRQEAGARLPPVS